MISDSGVKVGRKKWSGSVTLHRSDSTLSHTQWITATPVLFWPPPGTDSQLSDFTDSGVPNFAGSGMCVRIDAKWLQFTLMS